MLAGVQVEDLIRAMQESSNLSKGKIKNMSKRIMEIKHQKYNKKKTCKVGKK